MTVSSITKLPALELPFLRQQIVGVDSIIETPFGKRLLVYCDYTASGRSLAFIEQYLLRLQRSYANPHTEDNQTGRTTTLLLKQAEQIIKDAVNAGPRGRLIACGTGTTSAIDKFQRLVGVNLPPVTRYMLETFLDQYLQKDRAEGFTRFLQTRQPVVFIGPYEHHSNEVTWREGLATVVPVQLTADGGIDLEHLERLLQEPAYQDRLRIGSFSAASNVTGMRTPVHKIASLLHRYGALACFDFAACAPYVTIDMNPAGACADKDPSLDAIFFSPHKFLGGPGASGILIFNEKLYHRKLAPSVGGGGTVDYVDLKDHDFIEDIEEREKAGTPGVLQTLKAALVMEVKEAVTVEKIEARERQLIQRAMQQWQANPNIEILGNLEPDRRLAIVSFNIKGPDKHYLHPKFVTVLLNDLFGIQSRAGCSCAGPYGHRLLDIDYGTSQHYRSWIRLGYHGIKPGWCRLGFHYVMDDAEADYVINAVDFVARHGHLFLTLYDFDVKSAGWSHKAHKTVAQDLSLQAALKGDSGEGKPLPPEERAERYAGFLREARELAEKLKPGTFKPV